MNFGAPGRPRILHLDDVDYLLHLIRQRPDWFLDELLNLLRSNHFISVHYTMVHNALVQAGISLKKLKKIASERNEDTRNEFIGHMAMYDLEELGFLDETSKNEKTVARSRRHAQKGQRAVMQQHFIHGHHLSNLLVSRKSAVISDETPDLSPTSPKTTTTFLMSSTSLKLTH